jgi:hypothetical protein
MKSVDAMNNPQILALMWLAPAILPLTPSILDHANRRRLSCKHLAQKIVGSLKKLPMNLGSTPDHSHRRLSLVFCNQ